MIAGIPIRNGLPGFRINTDALCNELFKQVLRAGKVAQKVS